MASTKTLYNARGIRSQRKVAKILGISQPMVLKIERRALLKLVARLQFVFCDLRK